MIIIPTPFDHNLPKKTIDKLFTLFNQGKLASTVAYAEKLTREFPNDFLLWNILGAANKGLGRLKHAEKYFRKASQLNPDFPGAQNNLGATLQIQGKFDEAIVAYTKALSIESDYYEAHYNMGNTLTDQSKFNEAILAYTNALRIKPDYHEAHNNIGVVFQYQGKLGEAIAEFKKALDIKPDYYDALNNLGISLHAQGKLDEAIAEFEKALDIKPDYYEAHNNLGVVFQDQGEDSRAISSYKKALKFKADYAIAHRHLSLMKNFKFGDAQIIAMRAIYDDLSLKDDNRCNICFALAKVYDDLGELERSLNYLIEGNALRKTILNYDIQQDQNLFRSIKKTAAVLQKHSLKGPLGKYTCKPIFILGMPRSGTTLIEQIISSHSQITGAGELPYLSRYGAAIATGRIPISTSVLINFKKQYLDELLKHADGKKFVVDKMPQNFLYLSLIFTAFPDAKIIHVKRDAAATCWSNYSHYFSQNGLGYCYDLEDVVTYYRMYQDLMDYWMTLFGAKIHHLDYEKLVVDQEYETRILLNSIGIDWESACLRPHENRRSVATSSRQQVRQKVYEGSSQKWRKFEPFLRGALDSFS